MFTEAVTTSCSPVELPFGGAKVSQAALSLTAQLSVPAPEFQISNVFAAGFDPPAVALKLKLAGLKAMVGWQTEMLTVPPIAVPRTETDPVVMTSVTLLFP